MLKYIWLVPALPLAGAAVNLVFGKRLGKWSGILGPVMVGGSFVISLLALFELLGKPPEERVYVAHLWDWFHAGALDVGADLRVDALSMTMILVVTGVGFLIHVYSIGYMHGDRLYPRFFAYLNLFVFFMLTLVLAQNFVVLFIGWEGVGLCSYLLIGFWFEKPAAANASKKAFITTRVGDTFFVVGLAMIFVYFGSFDFDKVLNGHAAGALSVGTLTAISLLLFGGAIGKSAQIPLHVWLPDAMEGPTPVSALIHAATMVTAGVYLVVRTHVLFTPTSLAVVMFIGLATALYAATSAVGQDDIKRLLAYSTLSQLGYMFFAAGMGAYGVAMFMLVAHAFYKALMFLAAGSVMHGMEGETDMTKMGGLKKYMPLTATLFMIGAITIAGIPPLSGFFAKDPILSLANRSGRGLAWLLADAAAFLTAFYTARLVFLTFFGESRTDKHAHESPKVMAVPMGLLAAGAAVAGVLAITPEGVLAKFLEPVTGLPGEFVGGLPEWALMVVSVLIALAAIWLGWYVYASTRWRALRERYPYVHDLLENGWYWDAAYANTIVPAGKWVAGIAAFGFDTGFIDGIVNGLGSLTKGLAAVGRRLQTGMVRTYAAVFLFGVFVVLLVLAVRS